MKKAKATALEKRERVIMLIRYAIYHNFVINPVGFGYYQEGFERFQHCPCDEARKSCPCPEAEAEVKDKGMCKCQLYWRDYKTYLEIKYTGLPSGNGG